MRYHISPINWKNIYFDNYIKAGRYIEKDEQLYSANEK